MTDSEFEALKAILRRMNPDTLPFLLKPEYKCPETTHRAVREIMLERAKN